MANDLTTNPWVIDTASASVLSSMLMRVKTVRWVGATTAGHKATIKDRNGKVMWDSVAAGANYVESELIEDITSWDGIAVTALDSGKLYITLA